MDTVCKLPFEAYIIVNPQVHSKKVLLGPWNCNTDCGQQIEKYCATIEENDELDLYFNAYDPDAKLYLDALECCPTTDRILVDDDGMIYCTPAEDVLRVYRSTIEYDALRVDTLQIMVQCNGNQYSSYLKVVPKQMSSQEWTIMRDDLEKEAKGLTQDVVRRNIGFGSDTEGVLPPDDLYAFLIIHKNAKSIMGALLDIKDKPKYKIKKHYEEVDESRNREIDTETVRQYLRKTSSDHKLIVPRRDVVYDIQENRLLKKIIKEYDTQINRFIMVIDSTLAYRKQQMDYTNKYSLYDVKYIEGLENYLETAKKLKKITNIVKNTEWYRKVENPRDMTIPHSFAIDPRYGTLYRLYNEIKRNNFEVELDPQYSYSWKKSSVLYEMWCYLCVCRHFLRRYDGSDASISDIFTREHLFPFLESGTKITVETEDRIIEIVYDSLLPLKSDKVAMYQSPLYITGITGRHNRPDICINLYSKKSGWYIGSYIIECKYRKLNAFWNGTTWCSKEQIIAYHNDSKSSLFFNGYLDLITASRPVHHVFVFTPDNFGIKEDKDDHVSLLTFKPTPDRKNVTAVCEMLLEKINKQVESADQFYNNLLNLRGNI